MKSELSSSDTVDFTPSKLPMLVTHKRSGRLVIILLLHSAEKYTGEHNYHGVIVGSEDPVSSRVGYTSDWDVRTMQPYQGKVTLYND